MGEGRGGLSDSSVDKPVLAVLLCSNVVFCPLRRRRGVTQDVEPKGHVYTTCQRG